MIKHLSAGMLMFLGLLLTGARAEATILLLQSPSIDFKIDADKTLTAALQAVVKDKQFTFYGGGWYMGWGKEHDGTTLIYQGDTKALEAFLNSLSRVKGLEVKIGLSSDLAKDVSPNWWKDAGIAEASRHIEGGKPVASPVPSWSLSHSKEVTGRVEVRINLAAKDLKLERLLEKWLKERSKKRD